MHAVTIATRSGSGPSDAALVVASVAGEGWATEALYRRHAPMVNGLALRLMGRHGEVDDLVQESFIEALASLAQLREPQAFGAWLARIVVGTASKMLRRRRVLSLFGARSGETPIDVDALIGRAVPADDMAELRAIYRIVDALPVKLRIVLVLRKVESRSLEEIAELTGSSLATVKRRLIEAEELLQKRIERGGRP